MLLNDVFYNAQIYMLRSTIKDYIAILSAEDVRNGSLTFGISSRLSGSDKFVCSCGRTFMNTSLNPAESFRLICMSAAAPGACDRGSDVAKARWGVGRWRLAGGDEGRLRVGPKQDGLESILL